MTKQRFRIHLAIVTTITAAAIVAIVLALTGAFSSGSDPCSSHGGSYKMGRNHYGATALCRDGTFEVDLGAGWRNWGQTPK